MDCIFCAIANGQTESKLIYADADLVAFNDMHPAAPTHVLIVPKKHFATLNDLSTAEVPLIGQMVLKATELATEFKLADNGYRLVWNCNRAAGQTVFHIHLHLLGGRQFIWPPG